MTPVQPYAKLTRLSPLVRRLVADNPGPFTFTGTATHIVGHGQVAVIDPGPDDDAHVSAILAATAGEEITAILVTHTHRDHTGALAALRAASDAEVLGCASHSFARPLREGEANPLEASGDRAYAPDRILTGGDTVSGPGWTLEAVPTPGHIANHLAFALHEENALFSGDHVMGWSTTIVAPPEGSMRAYRASLQRLLARSEQRYYPAHGELIEDGPARAAELLQHRNGREQQILEALRQGAATPEAIVERIYSGLAPALKGAAALSVLAHLEDLVERNLVRAEAARFLLTAPSCSDRS